MDWFVTHKWLMAFIAIFGVLLVTVVIEVLIIKFNGTPVAVPDIPRSAQVFGSGQPLRYVVLGDSTAVGQGGAYKDGIAVSGARHLAQNYQVTMYNFAVSGARMHDVLTKQLTDALAAKPDVVLLSAAANDVTHLTAPSDVARDMEVIISEIRAVNPKTRIVITGSPDMGSVPRFPQPVKYWASVRTEKMNEVLRALASDKKVTFAPIAEKTGPIFRQNPQLFAQDKFHPNTAGYATWVPVVNDALDRSKVF